MFRKGYLAVRLLIVLDRMLAICQVCVFRFIRWAYLALPFQHQDGMQDTVSLGLGVVHVSERSFCVTFDD